MQVKATGTDRKGPSYFPGLSVLTSGFEGCEKRLLMHFTTSVGGDLRKIGRQQWTDILKYANCSILNAKANDIFMAYLLSESSLFVYKNHIIIKTCGTTTLLKMIPSLLKMASTVGCVYGHVRYSRSHFMFPHKQVYPHRSFGMESEYLDETFNGHAYILGPLKAARWHVYAAGNGHALDKSVTLEIVMFDLDRSIMDIFTQEYANGSSHRCTVESGIVKLFPKDVIIDDYIFKPCGYSLNALWGSTYWTIHITPEAIGSFVSFETNQVLSDYSELVERIIGLFKPQRLSCVFSHEGGLKDPPKIPGIYKGFEMKTWTKTTISSDFFVSLQTFVTAG